MDDLHALVAAAPEGPDEEAVARSWLGAAREWAARVQGRVMQPWRQAEQTPDASMVLSENGVWVQELTDQVRPTLLGVLRRGYQRARGQAPPPGFDQQTYVTQYLDASVNRMAGTPDEVYRQISATIAQGTADGESIPQLAARVEEILTVTGSETWANRGTVVARTEVNAAQNAGALAAAGRRQAEDGVPMVKTWIATTRPPSSERTRPSHLAADGQTVPLTEPFMVGGEPLQYPGDPAGSARNVIQCRCTLIVRAADETPTDMTDRQLTGGTDG